MCQAVNDLCPASAVVAGQEYAIRPGKEIRAGDANGNSVAAVGAIGLYPPGIGP